jgi:hypothetical protein
MYRGQSRLLGCCVHCEEHLGCVRVKYVLTSRLFTTVKAVCCRFQVSSDGKLFILIFCWPVVWNHMPDIWLLLSNYYIQPSLCRCNLFMKTVHSAEISEVKFVAADVQV